MNRDGFPFCSSHYYAQLYFNARHIIPVWLAYRKANSFKAAPFFLGTSNAMHVTNVTPSYFRNMMVAHACLHTLTNAGPFSYFTYNKKMVKGFRLMCIYIVLACIPRESYKMITYLVYKIMAGFYVVWWFLLWSSWCIFSLVCDLPAAIVVVNQIR